MAFFINIRGIRLALGVGALALSFSTAATAGPDVIVSDLPGFANYGASGSIHAFAIGTESCNIGDVPANWYATTPQHPVIGQNLFRLEGGRFEQIGQAWVKHGFFAQLSSNCGTCINPHPGIPPQNNPGTLLGVMCSDVYSASLNGDQMAVGPKAPINAHTGVFPYPFTIPPGFEMPEPIIGRRLQVELSDFDPAIRTSALFFVEGQYVTPDDAAAGNQNNNASYRQITFSGPHASGAPYRMQSAGSVQEQLPAIRAWKMHDPSVVETDIQLPAEGLFILAAKATDMGDGFWEYEYALYNMNSDRSAGSFTVPLPAGALIQPGSVGFHDVAYHSGEPYDGTDWMVSTVDDEITWATVAHAMNPNANALRWGTVYNFRFRTNVEPETTMVTIGLFKPGPFDTWEASTIGPRRSLIDCNDNKVHDACDLMGCDLMVCGVCGISPDCNENQVPDECEVDCNVNGVPDWCDVDPLDPDGNSEVSVDCNGNLVPDECEPDCDENGIPDDCLPPGDRDEDGIDDCADLCPDTNPLGTCVCPPTGLCCFPELGGACFPDITPTQCLSFGGVPECLASQVCRGGCLLGDGDNDGDLDLRDFSDLQSCFSGAGFQAPTLECGNVFDYNLDTDVDMVDHAVFQSVLTGP